jgi:hypothetical protein
MWYKLRRHLQHVPDNRTSRELLRAVQDVCNTQCLSSAGLATNTAAVKAGNTLIVAVNGTLQVYAANQAMGLLGGPNIPNTGAVYGLWAFTVDNTGTFWAIASPANGNAAAAGALIWPTIPDNMAVLGYMVLQNASAGAFTPNTTSLATAGITTTFANLCGPEYPLTEFGQ